MGNITDDELENNYLEAQAKHVADWLAMHGWLTGRQRAVLVLLSSAIDEALAADTQETAEAT